MRRLKVNIASIYRVEPKTVVWLSSSNAQRKLKKGKPHISYDPKVKSLKPTTYAEHSQFQNYYLSCNLIKGFPLTKKWIIIYFQGVNTEDTGN